MNGQDGTNTKKYMAIKLSPQANTYDNTIRE